MIKLLEEELEIKVRQDEVALVKGMLADCERLFTKTMKDETTRDYSCKLKVCEDIFLLDREGGSCGGIILLAHNRRIVVPNTLEDRMNLVFEQELPMIRHGLFPADKKGK
jgi:vacuolar-type H+-ATPase subunit E/Vma4